MKKLMDFLNFDLMRFLKGKTLLLTGAKWNEKKNCITCEAGIIVDETVYSDPSITNLLEKFKIDIPNSKQSDLSRYKIKEKCIIDSYVSAKVWGDFNQNLTVVGTIKQ